jgi:hypothetical protein
LSLPAKTRPTRTYAPLTLLCVVGGDVDQETKSLKEQMFDKVLLWALSTTDRCFGHHQKSFFRWLLFQQQLFSDSHSSSSSLFSSSKVAKLIGLDVVSIIGQ